MRSIATLAAGALLLGTLATASAAVAAPISPLHAASDRATIIKAEWGHDGFYGRRDGEWGPRYPGWRSRHWGWRHHRDWGRGYGYSSYERGWGGPRGAW